MNILNWTKIIWTGIVLCGLNTSAFAQQSPCGGTPNTLQSSLKGLYQGIVAGLPVVLKLDKAHSYFYKKTGIDIELSSATKNNLLILEEKSTSNSGDKITACFSLTQKGQNLTGTWKKVNNKRSHPVKLTRIKPQQIQIVLPKTPELLKLKRDDPYTLLKINHPWRTIKAGQAIIEPLSKIEYLRLPHESKALNETLQDRQMKLAIDALECFSFNHQHTDYEVGLSPIFMTKKLVSFLENSYYYCGGAHPSGALEGVILDRLTGQPISFNQLFPYLNQKQQHQFYLAKYPQDTDTECRQAIAEQDMPQYTAHLTQVGVQLTPQGLPHVYRACGESVLIPYQQFKPYISRQSGYFSEFY